MEEDQHEGMYDEIKGKHEEEASLIDTKSTDSLDTTVTNTNRSILSRVNERIVEVQVNLHETVSDWGIRTENILVLFWGGIVFFIGLSFNIAQANTTLSGDKFATTYWVLFSFMAIGIFLMAIALHHRENENIFVYDLEEELGDSNSILKLLLWNVFVFGIGLYLIDLMAIVKVFHCGFGELTSTQENQYSAIFVYHFTRFVYVSLQLFLLQVLIGAKVRRSGYYQFAVKLLCVHVIVTNISIWLSKFSQETGIFHSNTLYGEYDILNCTLDVKNDDTFYVMAKKMDQVMEPFILEFCILAVALFYTMYPLLKDTQMLGKLSSSGTGYGYKYKAVNVVKDATKTYRSMPALMLGCFLALLLVVSSWNLKNFADRIHNLRFSFIVQIIIFALMLTICRMALHQLKNYHRMQHHDHTYRIEDILLIVSGPLGYLPFCLLILFASFAFNKNDVKQFLSNDEAEMRVWSVIWAVVAVISVFVQTHLLIVGRHFKRDVVEERTRRSSEDISEDSHYVMRVFSAGKIGQYLIILLLCNFGLWFMESFFEVDSSLQIPQTLSSTVTTHKFSIFVIAREYWGHEAWEIIRKLLYPFLVFYRLHSVTIIYFIWRKFQVDE